MKFSVQGDPAGQGSWVAFSTRNVQVRCNACGRTHCKPMAVPTGGARLTSWRKAVHRTVQSLWPEKPTGCAPVRVTIELRFLQPKRPAHTYPKLDIDKLARAILDALTGAAYVDDSQVVELRVSKHWVHEPGLVGAVVEVEPATPADMLPLTG